MITFFDRPSIKTQEIDRLYLLLKENFNNYGINYDFVENITCSLLETLIFCQGLSKMNQIITLRKAYEYHLQHFLDLRPNVTKEDFGIEVLYGLHGSGKTSLVNKIGYLKSKNIPVEKICAISVDQDRPQGFQQLKHNCDQLAIDSVSACFSNEEDFNDLLNLIQDFKKRGKKYLIIDTPAFNKQNSNSLKYFNDVISSNFKLQNTLVVDGLSGMNLLEKIESLLTNIKCSSIAITKTDHEINPAQIVNLISMFNVPISYLTNGEKYGNIEHFNIEKISKIEPINSNIINECYNPYALKPQDLYIKISYDSILRNLENFINRSNGFRIFHKWIDKNLSYSCADKIYDNVISFRNIITSLTTSEKKDKYLSEQRIEELKDMNINKTKANIDILFFLLS